MSIHRIQHPIQRHIADAYSTKGEKPDESPRPDGGARLEQTGARLERLSDIANPDKIESLLGGRDILDRVRAGQAEKRAGEARDLAGERQGWSDGLHIPHAGLTQLQRWELVKEGGQQVGTGLAKLATTVGGGAIVGGPVGAGVAAAGLGATALDIGDGADKIITGVLGQPLGEAVSDAVNGTPTGPLTGTVTPTNTEVTGPPQNPAPAENNPAPSGNAPPAGGNNPPPGGGNPPTPAPAPSEGNTPSDGKSPPEGDTPPPPPPPPPPPKKEQKEESPNPLELPDLGVTLFDGLTADQQSRARERYGMQDFEARLRDPSGRRAEATQPSNTRSRHRESRPADVQTAPEGIELYRRHTTQSSFTNPTPSEGGQARSDARSQEVTERASRTLGALQGPETSRPAEGGSGDGSGEGGGQGRPPPLPIALRQRIRG